MNSQKGEPLKTIALKSYFILLIKQKEIYKTLKTKRQKLDVRILGVFTLRNPIRQDKFSTLLPLFLLVTIPSPFPSFVWFGQYLNTTTNYPIMGLCPYHFGLVNTWHSVGITLFGLMPL